MERIGWSDGDVASFLSTYSNFEEEDNEKKQHQKPKSRVEKVVKVEKPDIKVAEKKVAAVAAAKEQKEITVIKDV